MTILKRQNYSNGEQNKGWDGQGITTKEQLEGVLGETERSCILIVVVVT